LIKLDMPRHGTPRVGYSPKSREGPSYERISPAPTNGELGKLKPHSWKTFLFYVFLCVFMSVYVCFVKDCLVQNLRGSIPEE